MNKLLAGIHLKYGLTVLLICVACFLSHAQDKNIKYYNRHENEILTDAKAAFVSCKYDRALELCEMYYVFFGVEAGDLQVKAKQCAKLTEEMNGLAEAGSVKEAAVKAQAILAMNPEDKAAQKVVEMSVPGSLKIVSTPPGAIIWLDGKNTLLTTPDILEDITSGSHTIKLSLSEYDDFIVTVTVSPGKRGFINKTLVSKAPPTTGTSNGHDWVDLGLSVKWATSNVGASSPEGYGDYFAWGGTQLKTDYSWLTYKFRVRGNNRDIKLNKYCTLSSYWYSSNPMDNKTVLDPEDDAAHMNRGGSWRVPTNEEWTELRTKCTWTWTTKNGVDGRKVTGPNGNSIFLPAAGYRNGTDLLDAGSYGDYWSSSLYTDYPSCAYDFRFYSDGVYRGRNGRCLGLSVRAVTE